MPENPRKPDKSDKPDKPDKPDKTPKPRDKDGATEPDAGPSLPPQIL